MKQLIVFFILLFITPAYAANIYVDNGTIESDATWSGVDGESYTSTDGIFPGAGTGYSTIQAAITNMTGGDDIWVRVGTYLEHDIKIPNTKSGSDSNYSQLASYPGEWAIIDGEQSCTSDPNAVISNGLYAGRDNPNVATHWRFSRLEITGGGRSGTATGVPGYGIFMSFGPHIIEYCYIHGNTGPWSNENPAGIGGVVWQDVTIQYNYVKDNTPNGSITTNAYEISVFSNYVEYTSTFNSDTIVTDSVVKYNYVESAVGGIRTKGTTWLTNNRSTPDTTYRDNALKIHHNIVIQKSNSFVPGIFAETDWAQVHNNIIDQTNAEDHYENWAIATRRVRTAVVNRDTLPAVIYNNTVFAGGDCIGDFMEGDSTEPVEWYVYNNILDNMDFTFSPITFGCSPTFCPDYDYTGHFALTDLNIDRNYIYRTTSTRAVYVGNSESAAIGSMTASEWETAKGGGVDIYVQAYDAGNLLYEGTTGADKYKTVATHTVDGSTELQNAGLNASHPYLSGVTIPDYVGATNPDDNAWVAGVLNNLTSTTWLAAQTTGEDPSWIEGAASGGSVTYSLTATGSVTYSPTATGSVIYQ